VVIDNGGWAAVKESTLRMYPQGEAGAAAQYQARLAGGMDFTKVVESAGGYGARIDHPDQVAGALERCIAEVKQGRPALLQAMVTSL
jgi:acetolactate synthase-1/2/3 large subunit